LRPLAALQQKPRDLFAVVLLQYARVTDRRQTDRRSAKCKPVMLLQVFVQNISIKFVKVHLLDDAGASSAKNNKSAHLTTGERSAQTNLWSTAKFGVFDRVIANSHAHAEHCIAAIGLAVYVGRIHRHQQ